MAQYVIYLRKSRADIEAEQRGEGETLARHKSALFELAKRQNLNVIDTYPEVLSGETIASRPVMQRLLNEVECGTWDGVLVMEVERLARGDTIDQGIVAQTFKFSSTKIITPMKTYDPSNEYDEEYFEFGLFMSRREYKTINRRLQGGRLASIKEGKYVANQPPYGYIRKKLECAKGFTLEPLPEETSIVKLIFDLYTTGASREDGSYRRLGISLIARHLNNLGIKPRKSDAWVAASIRDILINPTYTGKLRWNFRPQKKKMVNGKVVVERPRNEDAVLVDGLHPAIVDSDIFNTAQQIISCNPAKPVSERNIIKNPLAGIVFCGKCGRGMIRKINSKGPNTLMCPAPHCDNISSALENVEQALLDSLHKLLLDYNIQINLSKETATSNKLSVYENQIKLLEQELQIAQKQLNKIYELHEQEKYSTEQFLDRSQIVFEQIEVAKSKIQSFYIEYNKEKALSQNSIYLIPKIERIINVYYSLLTAQAKNDLLTEVLDKVTYIKNKSGHFKDVNPKDFVLQVFPKLVVIK